LIVPFQEGLGRVPALRPSTTISTAAAGPLTASSMGYGPVISPKKRVRKAMVIVVSWWKLRLRASEQALCRAAPPGTVGRE